MPDREQLDAWRANGITDPAQLVVGDWRRNGMIVTYHEGRPSVREAMVKRHRRNEWSLDLLPQVNRNRWGNLREITADIEVFKTCGALPEPEGGRW